MFQLQTISLQDTVIGIHALAKLGEKLSTKDNNVAITFNYENGGQSQININSANVMILQKHTVSWKNGTFVKEDEIKNSSN